MGVPFEERLKCWSEEQLSIIEHTRMGKNCINMHPKGSRTEYSASHLLDHVYTALIVPSTWPLLFPIGRIPTARPAH